MAQGRALIERVVISPGPDRDGGAEVELMALLQAGGALSQPEEASAGAEVLRRIQSSTK